MDYAIYVPEFNKEQQAIVDEVLNKYSITSKRAGKTYLEAVIKLCYCNRLLLRSLDQYIYPIVAKMHGTKPGNVEKNIKNSMGIINVKNRRLTTKNLISLILRELHARFDSL